MVLAARVDLERHRRRDQAREPGTRHPGPHLVQADVDRWGQVDGADAVPAGVEGHLVTTRSKLGDLGEGNAQRAAEGTLRADQSDDVGDLHQRSVAFTLPPAGRSRVTTPRAPTTAPLPTVTPRRISAWAATQAPFSYRDGTVVVLKRSRAGVVAPRTEERALRQADVLADRDRLEVEQPDVLADPAVVADAELPRPQDAHAVPDEDALADVGTERPEQLRPPGLGTPPRHEDEVHRGEPRGLPVLAAASVVAVAGERTQRPYGNLVAQSSARSCHVGQRPPRQRAQTSS